jgi:hypothetical protein
MSANPYNPVSQIPNMGRQWSLVVTSPPDDTGNSTQATLASTGFIPEPMRLVFEVNLPGYSSHATFWTAKIEIYNLGVDQAQQFISGQGSTVVLSAGFQTGSFGIIFAGEVYQALYERPDVIDSKVTLMCYTGIKETIANFAQFRGNANMTQMALISKMCAGAQNPITINSGSTDTLNSMPTAQSQLPRARPFFGDPHKYIDAVAAANNLQSWYGSDGLSVSTMSDADAVSTITYTSTTGIYGVPQQTQDGVNFIVALDPRLRVSVPPMQVNIASSIIRQFEFTPPGYRPILDPNGLYLVNGLQHRGDSRGNQWETEIIAFTSIGGRAAYVYDATSPAGSPELDRRAPYGN